MSSRTSADNTAQVRYENRVAVLKEFLCGQIQSAGEVAQRVGLSRQTVMKAIQFYLRTGLMVPAGKGDSTSLGGKRPECFALTRDRYFLCITLWPEELHLHLTTIGGLAAGELTLQMPVLPDPREMVDRIGRLCAQLVSQSGASMEQIVAVSISAAGILDSDTGTLRCSVQFPEWGKDVPLRELLRPWFVPGTLICLESAGNRTARPILEDPELSGKRAAVIFSGWGLSACLIAEGKILSGANSLMGQIGHMTIDPADPELCGCGSRGCLERLVSAARVKELAGRWAESFPASPLQQTDRLTLPMVFEASAAGDPLAGALAEYLAEKFALALRSISLIFDPELVVFQGDYAHADAHFQQVLRSKLSQLGYFSADDPFEIRYDRRPLIQMDACGGLLALRQLYFGQPELYTET